VFTTVGWRLSQTLRRSRFSGMKPSAAPLIFFFLLGIGVTCAQNPRPATPPGAFVDVDGGRVYYQECGTGSDAVVLLHDGVVNSAVWDDVWPAFCKRFHTIRYDRRGYGRSPLQPSRITRPMIWQLSCTTGKSLTPPWLPARTAAKSRSTSYFVIPHMLAIYC
jgi:hypothetical protein